MKKDADSRKTARFRRRAFEAAAWTALIALLWGADTLTKLALRERTGVGLDDFRLFAEQATSGAAALVMVSFVAWWLRRFPLTLTRPLRTVVAHIAGTGLFATGHYALIVLFRIVVYGAFGVPYLVRQNHLDNLAFEYFKDIKIYIGMVVVITVYRRFTDHAAAATPDQPPAGPEPRKMMVQTGSGERLIDLEQIDYLEAARNYVTIHAGGREYLVRETLSNLENSLPSGRFLRTHRSFVVNIDRISEIRPGEGGGQTLRIGDGASVPVSRTYRAAVRERLARAALAR